MISKFLTKIGVFRKMIGNREKGMNIEMIDVKKKKMW